VRTRPSPPIVEGPEDRDLREWLDGSPLVRDAVVEGDEALAAVGLLGLRFSHRFLIVMADAD
jgi:hypothetical protein